MYKKKTRERSNQFIKVWYFVGNKCWKLSKKISEISYRVIIINSENVSRSISRKFCWESNYFVTILMEIIVLTYFRNYNNVFWWKINFFRDRKINFWHLHAKALCTIVHETIISYLKKFWVDFRLLEKLRYNQYLTYKLWIKYGCQKD